MPITLDENLDPALYPLAWLIGRWSGNGALALADEDGAPSGRLIEQEVSVEAADDAALSWRMRTWVLDAPPPVPPTAVFAQDAGGSGAGDERAPLDPSGGDLPASPPTRTLLVDEEATWRVGDPLPGQDLAAAQAAPPGSPAAAVSYALSVSLRTADGRREEYVGEVRGPRIQLATTEVEDPSSPIPVLAARRMLGYVNGRLMWVLDRMTETSGMASYLSAELDRV